MSRFYVGQRVRVIKTNNYPECIGMEATIVAIDVPAWSPQLGRYLGCELDLKVIGRRYGRPCSLKPPPEHLEPILDPGLEACDEDFKRDLDKLLERQGVAA